MHSPLPAELIVTPDNKVYHLQIDGNDVADIVLLVGDPGRAEMVAKRFDAIDCRVQNREFIVITGSLQSKRLSVIGTGIGPDNIDIVINELDAAVNFDLSTKHAKQKQRSLKLVRIGTSGALQSDIKVGRFVCSAFGLGIDGLLNFYSALHTINESEITQPFVKHMNWPHRLAYPYCVSADSELLQALGADCEIGITLTAPGFYAPQGRQLRLEPEIQAFVENLRSFKFNNQRILNFEMETAALFGLAKLLGHQSASICVAIANRVTGDFDENYQEHVEKLIDYTLKKLLQ